MMVHRIFVLRTNKQNHTNERVSMVGLNLGATTIGTAIMFTNNGFSEIVLIYEIGTGMMQYIQKAMINGYGPYRENAHSVLKF